jgi:starch phosphorylase
MKPIKTFTVSPSLPEGLEGLRELAHNLRWAWNHDTIELFRRLGFDLWEETGHNPVLALGRVDQQRLEELAHDDGFLAHYERVRADLQNYLETQTTWYRKTYGGTGEPVIAYFSAEFGVTECVPIYAGGLGILAGDHLKSASELGVPLVGVGLLYQKGYFHQYLNPDGWQQELYPENDFYNMPIVLQRRDDGSPLTVEVEFPGRTIVAQIWRAQVGRIALYLLDTNIDANNPVDQDITDELYGGDREMRIKQEIVLGIGGVRALTALGIDPVVCHMNEGHSAFLALERIRILMSQRGLSFAEAREVAAGGHVFTTHTPVAAGHDYFDPDLMDRYFSEYYSALGLSRKEFLGLGRQNPSDEKEPFCMTILALRLAHHRNAVSQLHEKVSRRMWAGIWPGVPEHEIPISHVTNGVHSSSWISKEMAALFDRYLGPRWREQPADQSVWEMIEEIPAAELWRTHELRRARLVAFVRRRLRAQVERQGGSSAEIEAAEEVLDPDVLTIGFGRRFASYKRATLLLRDEERFVKLLSDPDRPLQIIFSGKAHPQDSPGKDLIRRIIHFARREEIRRRIVFIEDYDMDVARYMVQGVDVWLNTPRRPREASGTSGMKAAFNGAINVSTLDGWWDEAYQPEVGWAIGRGEEYEDNDLQDEVESSALYDILEKDVVPTFYDRGPDGLPRRWLERMKSSMANLCPRFNTNRMVREYSERFYVEACRRFEHLSVDDYSAARALAAWRSTVEARWPQVRIEAVEATSDDHLHVGDRLEVRARVQLGDLSPEDVSVELYLGRLDTKGTIVEPQIEIMEHQGTESSGVHVFVAGAVPCSKSGLHGFTVRVRPQHEDLESPWDLGLVTWA